MIVEGEYQLKSTLLWVISIVYTIAGLATGVFRYLLPLFDESMNTSVFAFLLNVLGSIPLILAEIKYIKLLLELKEFKRQIVILIAGLFIAIGGLELFAFFHL